MHNLCLGTGEQLDVLNLAHDYIIIRDVKSRVLFLNSSAQRGYGWTLEQAYGKITHELFQTVFPESREAVTEALFTKGKWEGELTHTTAAGANILVQSSQALKFGHNHTPELILEINRDITQTKNWDAELKRLSQLDLIGEMAASICHEVRNPMTTIKGYLQMFQKKDEQHRDQINIMIEELDRANKIITEFLSLAKSKSIEFLPGNLNVTINSLLPLLQANAIRRGMDIQLELADLPTLLYDNSEIRQVILNLAHNALEAMRPGGILTIKTYCEDKKVVLCIQDTGTGIAQEIREKIGTPFFTTKERGTGLGLSVCYRIVHRHNAKLEYESSKEGTTFFVKFDM